MGPLSTSSCFELIFDQNIVQILGPKIYKYCTASCECNLNSNAICNENLKCICPPPYTGFDCGRCVQGFLLIDGRCVKQNFNEYPKIKLAKFMDDPPFNSKDYISLIVSFSKEPYNKENQKINDQNYTDLINSFILSNLSKGKSIKAKSAHPSYQSSTQ